MSLGSLASSDPLRRGLVGWYRMWGDGIDSSGTNNTGTLVGSPSAAADKFGNSGKAFSFNGTSSHIAVTQTTLPIFSESRGYTIAAWANSAANSAIHTIYGEGNNGNNNVTCSLRNNNGALEFWVRSTNNQTVIDGSSASRVTGVFTTTGVWKHVAATADPVAGTFAVYVDGTAQKTGSFTQINMGASPLNTSTIGSIVRASSQALNFFNGSISDVRLYTRALSAAEIGTLYRAAQRI